MSLRADIEAIHADDALDDARKRAALYRLKTRALIDALIDSPLLGRPYSHNGTSYFIYSMTAGPHDELVFDVAINQARHTVYIVNPPTVPRLPRGDERADLQRAVVEMLEGFGQ